jgi:hypothetical protein
VVTVRPLASDRLRFLHSKQLARRSDRRPRLNTRRIGGAGSGNKTAVNNLSFADWYRMTLFRLGLPLTRSRAYGAHRRDEGLPGIVPLPALPTAPRLKVLGFLLSSPPFLLAGVRPSSAWIGLYKRSTRRSRPSRGDRAARSFSTTTLRDNRTGIMRRRRFAFLT